MSQFKTEDVVLVYEGTPTFEDGMVGQIIDRDPNDDYYAVADLRDIGKADRDIGVILERHVKWIHPENMVKLEFDRPIEEEVPPKVDLNMLIAMGFVLSLLGLGILFQ